MPPVDDRLAALRRIALAVAQPGGADPFGRLVAELAAALGVGAAFVAVFADTTQLTLRTLGACLDGRARACPLAPGCVLKGALCRATASFLESLDGIALSSLIPQS